MTRTGRPLTTCSFTPLASFFPDFSEEKKTKNIILNSFQTLTALIIMLKRLFYYFSSSFFGIRESHALCFFLCPTSQSSSRVPLPLIWGAWDEIMIMKINVIGWKLWRDEIRTARKASFGSHIFCVPTTVFSSHNASLKSETLRFCSNCNASRKGSSCFGFETNLCLLVVSKDSWACQSCTLQKRQHGK